MEKYYIISGVALANIQFRESRQWYQANSHFENEKISESQFNKFRRFFKIEKQEEVLNGKPTYATQPKQEYTTQSVKKENVVEQPKVEQPQVKVEEDNLFN